MYDVVVIGGGVVGLAVARALTLTLCPTDSNHLQKVAVVERSPNLLSEASGGNSGIVCTGVDASPYTLERSLIRDSISLIRPYCERHNIPTRPCGSLVCLWKNEDDGNAVDTANACDNSEALHAALKESHDAGDTHAKILTREQMACTIDDDKDDNDNSVIVTEQNLDSSRLVGAVHIPGEIVVDPWLYSISLACHAKENGCTIYTDYEVDIDNMIFESNDGDGVWTIPRKIQDDETNNTNPTELKARIVINAAGLWAQQVEEKIRLPKTSLSPSSLDGCPWQARPRRGQYRIYRATPSTTIEHPIQPVPTPRTKGVFVFSNLFQNLIVVGPTALDQESKNDKSIDEQVATQLDTIAKRTIPSIDPINDYVGDYVGIRPGTQHRDYQIHALPSRQWIAVAGIRSTGLTASLGIGNYVSRLATMILQQLPTQNHSETSLLPPREPSMMKTTTPMPSIDELIHSYREHQLRGKQGSVTIHGHEYYVTHPLSRMSFEEMILSSSSGGLAENS